MTENTEISFPGQPVDRLGGERGLAYLGTPAERRELFKRELLAAALRYADRGYPIFPVSGAKKPLVRWGLGEDDHPDLAQRRATTDADTIRKWWARWPGAMIGLATGARSGIIVLDVDRKGGVDGLVNLRGAGIDPFAMTNVIAETPSGGLHFFFKYNGALKNSASLIVPGVDIRADGGFVVLSPSLPTGKDNEYSWAEATNGLAQ